MKMETESAEGIAESILDEALRLDFSDVIVNAVVSDTRQIRFSENDIDIFNRWLDTSYQLFLVRDKRVVATTAKGLADYREVLENARKTAERSTPSEEYGGIARSTSARNYSTREKMVSDADLSGLVHDSIDRAAGNGATGSAGSLYNTFYTRFLVTSAGIRRRESSASYYFSIRCFAGEGASGHSVVASLSRSRFKPEKAALKASALASAAKNPAGGQEGRFDAVLDPMVVAALVSQVGNMASAYTVISGFSCLAGKMGRKVASPLVTVEDDATRGLYGFRAFDDEGVAVRRTTIISRGVLKSYLHNTSTARKFRTRSTGNAGLIAPEAFMLSMREGNSTQDEMIADVRNGLYINNTWYTRYSNYARGDFSTIPRDAIFLIRRGEIAGSVRGIRITENLISLMKRISDLSGEREHLSWWGESETPSSVPYATVRKLNVTRSSDA
jgi:PmbA protein